MARAISHRGPDARGNFSDSHVGLAHTRLSVIDLDNGHQPMHSAEGRLTIVFNGEIYNFRELRSQLRASGYLFQTRSDTEVILNLYRQEGWQGFARLRGMYAFALWDSDIQTGLLARDPQGIKPLFYTENNEGFVFGSEAKAILASDAAHGKLDASALHLLLNFRYLPGNDSLFQGICQLPPGTVLVWSLQTSQTRRSIVPQAPDDCDPLETFSEAVRLHCVADVEVGAYLSGGIDSAAITALAKNSALTSLRTFTLDVGDDPNEASNAAATARLLGVENLQANGVDETETILPRLIRHLEVPKINALQVSQLARHAGRQIKVVLSGLGGDELFYGYNAHAILARAVRAERLCPRRLSVLLGGAGRRMLRSLPGTAWSESERALRMLASLGDWPHVYGLLRNVWDSPGMRRWIYGPRMLDAHLPSAFDVLESLWPDDPDPLRAMALFEWRNKMVNDLLWQEDRLSMAEGLEVRVPFLDVKFASQIMAMARPRLMPQGRRKGYLLEMLRNVLPNEIVSRPKSGFQVQAAAFVTHHLGLLINEWLSEERIRHYGLFNPGFVRDVLKRQPHTRLRWHYFMLYFMLMTHLWMAEFESAG